MGRSICSDDIGSSHFASMILLRLAVLLSLNLLSDGFLDSKEKIITIDGFRVIARYGSLLSMCTAILQRCFALCLYDGSSSTCLCSSFHSEYIFDELHFSVEKVEFDLARKDKLISCRIHCGNPCILQNSIAKPVFYASTL